jgi:hypothetical protein
MIILITIDNFCFTALYFIVFNYAIVYLILQLKYILKTKIINNYILYIKFY